MTIQHPLGRKALALGLVTVALSAAPGVRAQDFLDPAKDRPLDYMPVSSDDFNAHRAAVYAGGMIADYKRRVGLDTEPTILRALDTFGRMLAGSDNKHVISNIVGQRDLQNDLFAAAESGEWDPLLDLAAVMLSFELRGHGLEAERVASLADRLARENCSWLARLYAHGIASVLFERAGDRDRHAEQRALRFKALAKLASDPFFAATRQEYLLEFWIADRGAPDADDDAFIAKLREENAGDTYAILIFEGLLYRAQAWASRGTRAAREVTDRGWEGFGEGMALAIEKTEQAYALQPKLYTAPAQMVDLLGPISAPDEIRDVWFERAIEIMPSNVEAWRSWFWFSIPRWGGDFESYIERMFSVVEHDDERVQIFRHALKIARPDVDQVAMMKDPDIQKALDRVHEVRLKLAKTPSDVRYENELYAVGLAFGHRKEEARKVVQQLHQPVSDWALGFYVMDPSWWEENILTEIDTPMPPTVAVLPFATKRDQYLEGVEPLPNGQDIPLNNDFLARREGFLREHYLAEYAEHTKDSESQRELGRDLIRAISRVQAVHKDEAERAKGEALLERFGKRPSEDPLVLYAAGLVASKTGRMSDAHRWLKRGAGALEGSTYGALSRLAVLRSAASSARLQQDNDRYGELARAFQDPVVEFLRSEVAKEADARLILSLVVHPQELVTWNLMLDHTHASEIAGDESIDVWLRLMIGGLSDAQTLFTPFSKIHSASNREIALQRLLVARQKFDRAHEMHPEWPEAAGARIRMHVAGLGGDDLASARKWLIRAMKTEFDFQPAIAGYQTCLQFARTDMVDRRYAFALELLNTDRFETALPLYYLDELWRLGVELDSVRWLHAPDHVRKTMERYAASHPEGEHGKQILAVSHWAAGRYGEAKAVLESMETKLEDFPPVVFSRVTSTAEQIRRDLTNWQANQK